MIYNFYILNSKYEHFKNSLFMILIIDYYYTSRINKIINAESTVYNILSQVLFSI